MAWANLFAHGVDTKRHQEHGQAELAHATQFGSDPSEARNCLTASGTRSGRRHARGSVLFEILLSVALFVGAATFALGAMKSVFSALDRTRREQEALDLARSALAELEAGLTTTADLRGDGPRSVGSMKANDRRRLDPAAATSRWVFDLDTQRTEFAGLSLVELTVSEGTEDGPDPSSPQGISVTIRQLMPLRESEAEAYEQDDLLEGLPEMEP